MLATIVALFLQTSVPVHFPKFAILDLPLLLTIYFGLSRRNPSTGLLLGMTIGLLQDSLSGPTVPSASTALRKRSSAIWRLRLARGSTPNIPIARFALTVIFFGVHQGIVVLTRRFLLAQPEPWFTVHLAIGAAVNAVVGVFLFMLLDKLRKN